MSASLFDLHLRAVRRDRASRMGIETFLYDRAFEDCLERLGDVRGNFDRVLVAGCPNPAWLGRLNAAKIEVVDPSPLLAARANGQVADLEDLPFAGESFNLCISIGLLDTANNLALAAAALNLALMPGGFLLGAIPGGQSFPRLRTAMLAADAVSGRASAHVHPRIEPAALAQLLTSAGFLDAVVDVDRVNVAYSSLDSLVGDLRAMGATNALAERSRIPLGRQAFLAAREAFLGGAERVTEQIEILNFAAWKPAKPIRQSLR